MENNGYGTICDDHTRLEPQGASRFSWSPL